MPARDPTEGTDPVRGARTRVDPRRARGQGGRNAMRAGSGKAGGGGDRHAGGLAEADWACECSRACRNASPRAVREAGRPRAGTPKGISGRSQVVCRNQCGDAGRGSDRVREGPRACRARVESRARRPEGMRGAGRIACEKARGHAGRGSSRVREGPSGCRGRVDSRAGRVRGSGVGIDPRRAVVRLAARSAPRRAPRGARRRCPDRRRGPGGGAGGWRGWRRSGAGWARAGRPRRAAARAG
jgi:hypothetical protein